MLFACSPVQMWGVLSLPLSWIELQGYTQTLEPAVDSKQKERLHIDKFVCIQIATVYFHEQDRIAQQKQQKFMVRYPDTRFWWYSDKNTPNKKFIMRPSQALDSTKVLSTFTVNKKTKFANSFGVTLPFMMMCPNERTIQYLYCKEMSNV